jgi:preprotein translocase subunit SecG
MGGSSAFGAKAGDVFTRITIITAAIWILLCVASVKLLSHVDPADIGSTSPVGTVTTPEREATDGTGTQTLAEEPATPPVTPEAPAE